jgi:hypothetical protein
MKIALTSLLLCVTHAKVGKISLVQSQVKEMNPGPCTGYVGYGTEHSLGGLGPRGVRCVNPDGTNTTFVSDWSPNTCAQLANGSEPCPGGCCDDQVCESACCPGQYGAACTNCPATWTHVEWQPGAYYPLTECSGHGTCDDGWNGTSTGVCACDKGYTGAGCELGPAPTSIDGGLDSACPDGILDGNCCACDQGFGKECIGYHGAETWKKAGMTGKVCCGNGCGAGGDPVCGPCWGHK